MHDLPGVGENLQDHLDLYVICECKGDLTYDNVVRPHRTVWAGLNISVQGPVASNLFETGGFWQADKQGAPDIQFHLGSGRASRPACQVEGRRHARTRPISIPGPAARSGCGRRTRRTIR